MLIVKKMDELKKYGFENRWKDTWVRKLHENDDGYYLALLVNPHNTKHEQNEMFVYGGYDDDISSENDIDIVANISILLEMIQDEVVEYKRDTINIYFDDLTESAKMKFYYAIDEDLISNNIPIAVYNINK